MVESHVRTYKFKQSISCNAIQCHFGVIQCTCLKFVHKSKLAHPSETNGYLGLGIAGGIYKGTFNLNHVRSFGGYLVHFSQKPPHNSKMVHHTVKQTEILALGFYVECTWVPIEPIDLKVKNNSL